MGWWAFDVFTQLAAFLTIADLAGQTILRNIGLFTYMIPVGLSFSANILVGNYIGKNKVVLAKKMSNLVMIITFIWSVSSMALVWYFEEGIITFYTKEIAVDAAIRKAWFVLILFVFFDCM
jgi:Na+-driven multidrug efflux pump